MSLLKADNSQQFQYMIDDQQLESSKLPSLNLQKMLSPYSSRRFLSKMQKSLKQLLRNPKAAVSYHLDVSQKEEEMFTYQVKEKNRDMLEILSKGIEEGSVSRYKQSLRNGTNHSILLAGRREAIKQPSCVVIKNRVETPVRRPGGWRQQQQQSQVKSMSVKEPKEHPSTSFRMKRPGTLKPLQLSKQPRVLRFQLLMNQHHDKQIDELKFLLNQIKKENSKKTSKSKGAEEKHVSFLL